MKLLFISFLKLLRGHEGEFEEILVGTCGNLVVQLEISMCFDTTVRRSCSRFTNNKNE